MIILRIAPCGTLVRIGSTFSDGPSAPFLLMGECKLRTVQSLAAYTTNPRAQRWPRHRKLRCIRKERGWDT